ncbi:unnamed protein product [Porites lobata]|uniref:Uncharacterized protein n=1 Tax=Porites lobata TaxID=104759 RepID=A0ABN8PV19_9CNID|nr:unnamed protein product [Porites lobata]
MKWCFVLLALISVSFQSAGGRPVTAGDCVQCTGYLPQCNLPGLFGFPKCTMSFEKCKFNKPRPFRPGILQLETDCY